MALPKWATTVTPLSKTLALIIFITFPILGFFLGMQYERAMFSRNVDNLISNPPGDNGDIQIGGKETYINISDCDEWARFVIEEKNIPTEKIHSCSSNQQTLNSNVVYLVDIFYGPADDCPSGCIYKRFLGVLTPDKSLLKELSLGPESVLDMIWAQPPLDTARNNSGFECPSLLDEYIEVELGTRGENYGWNLNFIQPLVCSWEEFDEVQQVLNRKSLTMDGNIFVYFENGREQWNSDGLTVLRDEIADQPLPQSCKYGESIYQSGESFSAEDGCNKCGCENGRVLCTTMACQ